MSRRYKITGGGSDNTASLKFDSGICKSEENSKVLSGYKSRLRPRPTRQTNYFRSPAAKRKRDFSCAESVAQFGLDFPINREHLSVTSVRQNKASLLRKNTISVLKHQSIAIGKEARHIGKLESSAAKRSRADTAGSTVAKKQKKKLLSKVATASTSDTESKGKEVTSKLWYPFIPPVTSSDSEEEEDSSEFSFGKTASSTSATSTTKKLASRNSKTTFTKENRKEKASNPTTSSKTNSSAETSSSKVFSSKSSTRFSFGRFSKSDSSAKNTASAEEVNKEASCSQQSLQSSSQVSKSRSSTKQQKSKGKLSSKSKSDESKSKSRKRYQSPPNHPLYSSKTFTNSSKTGSCASTSRRGRGSKSSSARTRGESGASEMSQEAGQAAEESQPNQADPSVAENQQGASSAAADNNANSAADLSDPDMSRLQALLEARGLPSHFFGALGPRVQQILHRSVNSGTNSKSQQLLQGMQATGDESRQLQSAIEMCQLLVMGNEDTLSGFPIKMAVPTLITLLKMEHNFDMMNHACRALTYMMEALPRSSGVVVDAVPVFLEKLQSIQCMDVAEQSLTALEMLSRRHSAAILRSNGLSSCLLYLDFFSLPAQRNALAVAANCCTVLSPSEHGADFNKYYGSSISMLVQRLSHHDKKCVESICLCFARLVDNFRNQSETLQKITNDGLLENFQNLLVVTPPLIGSSTFVMVIRTMCLLCSSCPNLATQLVRNNIAETLRYLLCGTATEAENIELVPRSPQELYEITSLIGELMPRLPLDDPMFGIDRLLKHNIKNSNSADAPVWQWKGDDGVWRPYFKHDNRMIEETHKSGDHEASLLIQGRVYMLDFNLLQQINEDTGNSRPIRRVAVDKDQSESAVVKTESISNIVDARVALVKDDHAVISQFVRSLFTLLYEVYGSSAGSPAVRHKCLRAVQRMIYYAEPELLRDVLKNLSVSSHIASMLSSNDLKVVVGALQMAMILMKKLPDVFQVFFRRQGVTHQVEQLLDEKHKVVGVDPTESPPSGSLQMSTASLSTPVLEGAPSSTNPSPMEAAPGRLSDILRRKYPSRKSTVKRLSASSLTPTPEDAHSKQGFTRNRASTVSTPTDKVISPPLTKAKAFAAALSTIDSATETPTGPKSKTGSNSARSSASSFFYNLNPVRWGRTSSSAGAGASSSANSPQSLSSSSSQGASLSRENLTLPNLKKTSKSRENREEVKQWIREQAKLFLHKYFSTEELDAGSLDGNKVDDQSLLKQLTSIAQSLISCNNLSDACESLRLLSNITSVSDVSSFELQHSGIISSLIIFLSLEDAEGKKESTALRKIKSATTPPMATRRRSKLEARKPPMIAEIDKSSSLEDHRPKSTFSDDTGHFVTESTSDQNDSVIDAREDCDKKYSESFHPVTAINRDERLRSFLNVFIGLPDNQFSSKPITVSELNDVELLRNFVEKLNLCVNQLEQFAVRSHDLPSAPGRGSQALNFFAKHQLKCQLQRHPECSKGKQWHSGPVRVDPLALVQAIERYLITRGYGTASSDEKSQAERRDIFMLMDEEESEDEIEVDDDDDDDDDDLHPLASSTSTHSSSTLSSAPKHRLELYVGSQKLPYNMTVYQAVKYYSEHQGRSPVLFVSSDRDTDDEMMVLSNNNVWNSTHTIYYKLVVDPDGQNSASSLNKKSSTKLSPKSHKRNDALYLHGHVAPLKRPLDRYLSNTFAYHSVSSDPSKEVLCLMRIVFGLALHWDNLYTPSSLRSDRELLPKAEFVSSKLSMKAHRQLQDPLIIMTGELPPWLSELAHCCPFIFSFETRQLLFRIVSFDRDRAMQYLYDTGALPDTNGPSSSAATSSMSSDTSHRFVPKIEKKKCVVKRESLLHQAEKVLQDHGNGRSLLEVQYEGEVGTGLGPTLEFYTLTSHELQKVELGLWRSDEKSASIESNRNAEPESLKKMAEKMSDIVEEEEEPPALPDNTFVHSPVGLYPTPIGRSAKFSAISKVKAKFRFLGKLLAKSAMDGRMVDIPLSVVCYKWLLGRENEITWFDLEQVDPGFTLTFNRLKSVLYQRLLTEQQTAIDVEKKVSVITMDGCSLEDLGLDFLLPGFPNIELMKGGSKMSLSIANIDKYLSLIAHWTLFEGVRHQLEALREGFQSIFTLRNIDYFFPEELDELFCGARYQPWSERELADCCLTDHGYSHDSETVKTLFRVLSQYDVTEQRSFLQFVTGSPHLPVGGLRALHPQLTVVRKTSEEGHSADEYLPSVMTCVNYLKLPEYSSESVMRQRMCKAAREGQKSFLLS